jgi:hypothetical protein
MAFVSLIRKIRTGGRRTTHAASASPEKAARAGALAYHHSTAVITPKNSGDPGPTVA